MSGPVVTDRTSVTSRSMDDATLLEVLHATATAIADALGGLDDWGPAGTVDGQYRHDLAADAAGLAVLDAAGVGILSEESGTSRLDRDLVVVIDPVDGSTNASHGIPWYATSLCAVDAGLLEHGQGRRVGHQVVPVLVVDGPGQAPVLQVGEHVRDGRGGGVEHLEQRGVVHGATLSEPDGVTGVRSTR